MGAKRNISWVFGSFLLLATMACSGGSQPSDQEIAQFWAQSSLRFANQGDVPSTIVSEPETPAKQIMVGGVVQGEGAGAVTVAVHEAEVCSSGYCPFEDKAPLASVQIPAAGYFSLVVPVRGQKVTLIAKSGSLKGMHYLGELSDRVDGLEINLE